MATMGQFVFRNHIRIESEYVDSNPNMSECSDMNHFKVTLRRGRKQFTLYFSQGYGISGEPKAKDVLNCLSSDSASVENARNFEDWCSNFGYDPDSRKAERIFRVCQAQADKLQAFLGNDLYQELLWKTEQL